MNDKKLDLILEKLGEISNEQQLMKQDQQEMKQEQKAMKQDQQNMRSEMNARFDTLETRFSILEEKVDGLDKKTDVIQEQVVKNTENIAVMQADIKDLKDNQEKILIIQERQEKTINLLSIRSIDQEAKLREVT